MMVQGHFIYNTLSRDIRLWFTDIYYFYAENYTYTPGWSMFFIIIGIGLAFSIERQKLKNVPFSERFMHVFKRMVILAIIQYVFNLINYGFMPDEFYLLHFVFVPFGNYTTFINPISSLMLSNFIAQIGFWSLIVFFLMHLPSYVRIAIAVITAYLGYYVFFVQGNMIFYILSGGILGSYIINEITKGKKERIFKVFLIIGIIFFILGLPIHMDTVNTRTLFGLIMFFIITSTNTNIGFDYLLEASNYADYLASPGFILYSIGLILILFAIFYWILDVKKKDYMIVKPLILWGNLTLTLYVTHFILLNQMVYNLKFYYYFSFFTFMIWTLTLCIFIYIGAVIWSRYNFKFSLEWIIQKYS